MVGFVLVTTVGLFGFTLHSITGWADRALAPEAAVVVLISVRLLLSHLEAGGVGARAGARP